MAMTIRSVSDPSPFVRPLDDANRSLLSQVRPSDWPTPEGRGTYDLVVLGGGTAGLVSAAGAAGLGARVAIAERALLGGDCLITGCVPSKALIRSARAAGEWRRAGALGIRLNGAPDVDFAAVMQRMRDRRAVISRHDSALRLRDLGVDVFLGAARFTSPRSVEVNGRTLRFNRAVIATGGRPTMPPVPGLAEVGALTSENFFWLTDRPARLGIIGAGPVGCEMAQTFARFGSQVTVFETAARALPRDDADASAAVARAFGEDGVRLELGVRLTEVGRRATGVSVQFERSGSASIMEVDVLLVAAGRTANVEALDLAAAGVAFDGRRVMVDDRLRTGNARIFAAGDVCSPWQFTHAADAMARIVLQNALFYGRRKVSALTIPWCTYTDPAVAHVGVLPDAAAESGRIETVVVPLADVDRSLVDEETNGFLKVHHERGRMRGCTIVAPHAGEMIGYAADLVARGERLGRLAETIQPYPTVAAAFRQAGDQYRRRLLTPRAQRWMTRYFRWTR